MVGIAKKKENSVAARRDRPKNKPPIMVAPDRDVPGIIASAVRLGKHLDTPATPD